MDMPPILVDQREGLPYTFQHPRYAGVLVKPGSLKTGDYSLDGYEGQAAVERKELGDLIACLMGENRARFERELERGVQLLAFMVVVEAPWVSVVKGDYTSNMRPHSACQSILAFAQRYRVTFHFAGTRAAAEYCTWGFLRQFWRDRVEEVKKAEKEK